MKLKRIKFYILLSYSFFFCFYYIKKLIYYIEPTIEFISERRSLMNICYIFNNHSRYQVLISLGSIIKNNPGENFNFYFIIPPNEKIDIFNYSLLLPQQSRIIVKHYQYSQTYLPRRSKLKCIWDGIIVVKLHLKDILTDIEKVLYLDTDIINVAPISDLWKYPLDNKTIAGTKRVFYKKVYHVNSGVILYNLNFLRKQNKKLWQCANRKLCEIDDFWHTHCLKKSRFEIPYRYDVEFSGMVLFKNVTKLQLDEETKVVFYHVKDHYHRFYNSKSIDDFWNFTIIANNTKVLNKFKSLFEISDWVNNEVEYRSKKVNRKIMEF